MTLGDAPTLPSVDTTVFLKAIWAYGLLSNAACVTPTRACTTGTTINVTILYVGDSVGAEVVVALVGWAVGLPAAIVGLSVGVAEGEADKGILVGL